MLPGSPQPSLINGPYSQPSQWHVDKSQQAGQGVSFRFQSHDQLAAPMMPTKVAMVRQVQNMKTMGNVATTIARPVVVS
jgi:hypothetical protein